MTLLKFVQVVVSDWISIAMSDRDRSSPPRLEGHLCQQTWVEISLRNLGAPRWGATASFPGVRTAPPSSQPERRLHRSHVPLLGRRVQAGPTVGSKAKLQLAASGGVGIDMVWIYVVVKTGLGIGRTLGIVLMLGGGWQTDRETDRERNRENERERFTIKIFTINCVGSHNFRSWEDQDLQLASWRSRRFGLSPKA